VTDDPYLWPGTTVLVNAFDIRDADELRHVEDELAGTVLALLDAVELPDEYGRDLLCKIHSTVFGLVYPWAGQLRTVGIEKGDGGGFTPPEHLEEALDAFEHELAAAPVGQPRAAFVRLLAGLYRDLNAGGSTLSAKELFLSHDWSGPQHPGHFIPLASQVAAAPRDYGRSRSFRPSASYS
jgi:cell filamentation protein